MAAEELKTLADCWISIHSEFNKKVAGACLRMATDVENEAVGTINHANRLLWAEEVRQDCLGKAREMMDSVLRNVTVAADPDAALTTDLLYVVSENINTYATGG